MWARCVGSLLARSFARVISLTSPIDLASVCRLDGAKDRQTTCQRQPCTRRLRPSVRPSFKGRARYERKKFGNYQMEGPRASEIHLSVCPHFRSAVGTQGCYAKCTCYIEMVFSRAIRTLWSSHDRQSQDLKGLCQPAKQARHYFDVHI